MRALAFGSVSSLVKPRPITGRTPNTRYKSPVVCIREICSAPLAPMMLSGGDCTSTSASNARARACHST